MAKEMKQFISACRPLHLKLADVKDLKEGAVLDVVLWEKDFEKRWIAKKLRGAKREKAYDAKVFFAANRCQITWRGDWAWTIQWPSLSSSYCNVEINHNDHSWVPIEDGEIQVHMGRRRAPIRAVEDYSDSTRIGCRGGPLMLWKNLDNQGPVYLKKKKSF